VGSDNYGTILLKKLRTNGAKADYVFKARDIHSGISLIFMDSCGQNNITHYPGVNIKFTFDELKDAGGLLDNSDIILSQLEIPLEIVFHLIKKYNRKNRIIILDPASYNSIPDNIFPYISVITPNRVEIEALTDIKVKSKKDSLKACKILQEKGINTVVNKLDKQGTSILKEDK